MTATGCFYQRITSSEMTFLLTELKKNVTPLLLLGEELYNVLSEYGNIMSWFDLQLGKLKYFLGASLLED